MEPEVSLPYAQPPTPLPCSEPDHSNPRPPNRFKIRFNIILPCTSRIPSTLFPPSVPTTPLYPPLVFPSRATCCTHLIIFHFIPRLMIWRKPHSNPRIFSVVAEGTVHHQFRFVYRETKILFNRTVVLIWSIGWSDCCCCRLEYRIIGLLLLLLSSLLLLLMFEVSDDRTVVFFSTGWWACFCLEYRIIGMLLFRVADYRNVVVQSSGWSDCCLEYRISDCCCCCCCLE